MVFMYFLYRVSSNDIIFHYFLYFTCMISMALVSILI